MKRLSTDSEFQHDDVSPWWTTLPFGFRNVRASNGSRPAGFCFSKFIINIEAELENAEIRACGEADTKDLAMTKALMELIERGSLMCWQQEGQKNPTSRTSNGWAAHETAILAKINAVFELVERDAVLAQWYLSCPFLEIAPKNWPDGIARWAQSELARSEFSRMKLLLSTQGHGPSLTCLFMNAEGYGVSGHATKTTLVDSIEAAVAETCRAAHHALRRSFWQDSQTLRDCVPSARVQPGAHAVYYAYHEPFPQWMFGPELSWADAERFWTRRMDFLLNQEFPKFEFHQTLEEPVVVGFASHPQVFELTWGTTDIQKILEEMGSRTFSLSMEGKTPNTQPHIVS